ncbi:heterokaryon incompatibility protein-domain-containing protein, partial [Pyrenochaeta sp. MPI-SDFR-AT-0127]
FDYRPLRSDSGFRLVRLHAGRREDDITCHIFHSTLWDHPSFEALSYTWGEMARLHVIFSTEGIVSITANCEAALRDLRYSFRDRILWIDALCIDQENDEEKNQQVPLMSRIYSAARRVVIYIG